MSSGRRGIHSCSFFSVPKQPFFQSLCFKPSLGYQICRSSGLNVLMGYLPWILMVGTCFFCAIAPAQSSLIWQPNFALEYRSNWPVWHAAALLGACLCALWMLILMCRFLPIFIVSWTAAVVVQALFGATLGRRHGFAADCYRMAVDMCRGAAVRAVREGKLVAIVTFLFCFLSLKKVS